MKKTKIIIIMFLTIFLSAVSVFAATNHYTTSQVPGEWVQTNGNYYWKKNSGGNLTSAFLEYKGNTYYLASDGVMAKGWAKIDGNWYYFKNWGGMYKNTFFDYDNNTYYVDASGIMAVGWKEINGNWYYFRSWGGMYKNCTKTISKETCSFDSDGIFYKSVLTLNRKQQEKDNWCWAASAQMVGLYKNPSSTVTQTDIVKKVYGTDVNLGGNHKDVITGINCMTGLSCSVNGQIGSSQFESNILIKNNPCVLYINWTGNALKLKGHYVVARGYNKWGDTVNVVDPAKGCTNLNDWISHADLTGPCKFQSGTGYYENTITIN